MMDGIYLYMKGTNRYHMGFRVFDLMLMNGPTKVDSVAVLSGYASRQYTPIPHPTRDYSRSGNPCPENVYDFPSGLEDAGKGESWGEGLGRFWVGLEPRFAANDRQAIGIHDDANREYSRGSAGCVCPFSPESIARIVGWFGQTRPPQCLIVDHGFGYLAQNGILVPVAVA
jgi:hypothetical protein